MAQLDATLLRRSTRSQARGYLARHWARGFYVAQGSFGKVVIAYAEDGKEYAIKVNASTKAQPAAHACRAAPDGVGRTGNAGTVPL